MNNHKGWDHYNQTTGIMNAPLYKINKTIIDRFKIQALPSIVEGQGASILVREIDARVLN
jgi:conjugal transfer pilus assembly protein TraW